MLISHKYKFIFIKTRKTAGTSIEVVLSQFMADDDVVTKIFPEEQSHRPRNYKFGDVELYNHMSAEEVRGVFGSEVFDGYFKFCVEREPVDKCISHFFMLKNSAFHNSAHSELTWESYLEAKDFPIDVEKYTDHRGELLVDKIVRYENMDSELFDIFQQLKIPCDALTAQAKTGFRDPAFKAADISHSQKEVIYSAFKGSSKYTGYSLAESFLMSDMSFVFFVHSLFRSGSTYFYNALKRAGEVHIYHEPMHEIIGSLPAAWDDLAKRKDQFKSTLRHDFLTGGYFDEFSHLLPSIKRLFDVKFSYNYYFMGAGDQAPEIKAYLNLLVSGAKKTPVLQCTRTVGRLDWLKENYKSKHVFLLRNPWDQWYSYKVDPYIENTPRIIYAQGNKPKVLESVFEASGATSLVGDSIQEKVSHATSHPLTPKQDYFLFFGVWVHAYVEGMQKCDVFIDMDALSQNEVYRAESVSMLSDAGLGVIDFSDAKLHRSIFSDRELENYYLAEEQVLEIYRQNGIDVEEIREYLKKARQESFISGRPTEGCASDILEDASRMRELLRARDGRIAELSQAALETDGLIIGLSQAVSDCEAQIVTLDEAVSERDVQIASLNTAIFELDGQAHSLNQAVSEHETQIIHLRQAVTERDAQISSLCEVVSDLKSQACSLNRAVSEHETQIASLKQVAIGRDAEIANFGQVISEYDTQIASLELAMTERDSQIFSLTDETVRRGEWALRLDAELKESQIKLMAVMQSNSWRLTKPLREVRRWTTQPGQQTRRYALASLLLLKRAYQALPLSAQTKAKHRYLLAKIAPNALLLSGSNPMTIPSFSIPAQVIPKKIMELKEVPVFTLSTTSKPIVSVIIPVYGELDYTLRCLESIANHSPLTPFEIIVVDDCSPDNSVEVLQKISGIRLIQNLENQGFIRSCNKGASVALGEYVLFLNNDTQVTPGWLDALLNTFEDFPGSGLVGSKLVYPDGRLQEAGGIIWRDGSAWNFGRFQDPQLPVYSYAREVDYCSGASIMLPKPIFDMLGGFDEHYLPAYCEDSDLALKVRDKGYRVIYQPMSTIIHFEGVTSGTDTTQGVKAYQVSNAKKLFTRWQERLSTHQPSGVDVDNAKDRSAVRRILVLDHCTPTPDQDAGSVTVINLLLLLREMGFQVTFIPEDNFLYMPGYTTALQSIGIEVLYAPYYTSVSQHLSEVGRRYDLAFLFRPGVVERHLKDVRKYCTDAKVLYHTVDLHFLRMTREAELLNDVLKLKEAKDMKARELIAIQSCDASIVHSTVELELLRSELPSAMLNVFPLIMNVPGTTARFGQRRDLVFVGGYQHTPNIDAVKFMVTDIMPLLRKQLPGVRFYAVGSKPPEEIKALACEDVIITGFVEDLNPLLDEKRVSVAPLRYGAGIKGKIGTAMAVGLPVVATSLAAEGMSFTEGENILIADSPKDFADAVSKLYLDEALWNSLSQVGIEFAENSWGATASWKTLNCILENLGINVESSGRKLSLYKAK